MANSFNVPAQVITVVIEVIKGGGKDNLSFSQTATVNLTGRVLSCEGFKLRNQDMGEHTIGGRATVCMSAELGTELAQATAEVYAERGFNQDLNPVLAIQFECTSLSAVSGGFLIKNVTGVEIVEDYESEQDPDTFIALAASIREETAQRSAEALERAALVKRQKRVELTADAVQDQNLFAKAKSFLNAPLRASSRVSDDPIGGGKKDTTPQSSFAPAKPVIVKRASH